MDACFPRRRLLAIRLIAAALAMLCGTSSGARAQTPTTEFNQLGVQRNRDYLHLQPFERLDTLTGNVIITLPIVSLPGNAGHDLTFELTYNANEAIDLVPWTFGARGIPLRIDNQADPPSGSIDNNVTNTRGITPVLVMGDQARRGTMFRDDPNGNTFAPHRWLLPLHRQCWKGHH